MVYRQMEVLDVFFTLIMSQLRKIAIQVLKGDVVLSEKELATERLKVCNACPSFRRLTRQCGLCNCFMDLKVKLLEAECPLEYW